MPCTAMKNTATSKKRQGDSKAQARQKVRETWRLCAFCLGTEEQNRHTNQSEPLVECSECHSCGHPTCMDWDREGKKYTIVRSYKWHCMECKTCERCHGKENDDQIIFCDRCDRGWHIYCLRPALSKLPKGTWFCPLCKPVEKHVPASPAPQSRAPLPKRKIESAAPHRKVIRIKRSSAGENEKASQTTSCADDAPFSGLLQGDDAETKMNEPNKDDMERFERSKRAAMNWLGGSLNEQLPNSKHVSGVDTVSTNANAAHTGKALPISMIRFGAFDINTWFQAPFPEEYSLVPDGRLWMCEFCLKYMKSRFMVTRHRMKCMMQFPPGQEIYRAGNISVFEVDGSKNKIYCQNLCLLAKLFLDHKTLYYDVEPFLFYVFVESDAYGSHFVGYFSKEKRSPMDYNVSCIMTLPIHQRRGWGYFFIEMSYLLSRKEKRRGSPERPLSDLGFLTYRSYWRLAVFRVLDADPVCSLEDICSRTGMKMDDVLYTLQDNNMLEVFHNEASTGRLPTEYEASKFADEKKVPPNDYRIVCDSEHIRASLAKHDAKNYVRVDPTKLRWTPFIHKRTGLEPITSNEVPG